MNPQRLTAWRWISKMFFWITGPIKEKACVQPFWESGCHLGSITSRCAEKEPALLERRPDSPEFQPRCHLPPNELTWCSQSGWKWSLLKNKEEKKLPKKKKNSKFTLEPISRNQNRGIPCFYLVKHGKILLGAYHRLLKSHTLTFVTRYQGLFSVRNLSTEAASLSWF